MSNEQKTQEVNVVPPYSERLGSIFDRVRDIAKNAGDNYLNSNIPGLNKLSINGHELNNLINTLKIVDGWANKDTHIRIMITCARILEAFEEGERIEREAKIEAAKKAVESQISEAEEKIKENKSQGKRPTRRKATKNDTIDSNK